jgi:hypothetical protein
MSNISDTMGKIIADTVIELCLSGAIETGEDPQDIANAALANILIQLSTIKEVDNVLLTVRKYSDGWGTHIHFDFLSADRAHFDKDFDWNVSAQPPKDSP